METEAEQADVTKVRVYYSAVTVGKSQPQAKTRSVQLCSAHRGLLPQEFSLKFPVEAITEILETDIASGYIGCLVWNSSPTESQV